MSGPSSSGQQGAPSPQTFGPGQLPSPGGGGCVTRGTPTPSHAGAPRGRALTARSARREARPTRATPSHALRGVKRPRYSRGKRGSLITWRGQVVGAAVRGRTPCTWRDRGCFPGGRPCAPDPRSACRRLRGAEFRKRWCRAPRTHVPESAGLCVPPASPGSRSFPSQPPSGKAHVGSLPDLRAAAVEEGWCLRGGEALPLQRCGGKDDLFCLPDWPVVRPTESPPPSERAGTPQAGP